MSINAETLRLLLAAGKDGYDAVVVAEAMARGDDARLIYSLVDNGRALGATDAVIGLNVFALAETINAQNAERATYFTRAAPGQGIKDAYRERRGMPEGEWRRLRQRILERDGYTCTYCGSEDDLACDHILAITRGGTNDENNLTTACRPCNSSKGDRLLEEWQSL